MFSTWDMNINTFAKEKYEIDTTDWFENFKIFFQIDSDNLIKCYTNSEFTDTIPNFSKCKIINNGHTFVHHNDIDFEKNEIELSTYKLNLKKQKYTLLEKYVYDIALFHIKRLNRVMDDSIVIEFWLTPTFSDPDSLHHDFQEMDWALFKKDIRPFLTTITYLNDNIYPTLITNIECLTDAKPYIDKYKDVVTLSFPICGKHTTFDGSRYLHSPANLLDKKLKIKNMKSPIKRYVLNIQLWDQPINHRPEYACEYENIRNDFDKDDPVFLFDPRPIEKTKLITLENSLVLSDLFNKIVVKNISFNTYYELGDVLNTVFDTSKYDSYIIESKKHSDA